MRDTVKSPPLPPDELHLTALHEAGHAVAAERFGLDCPIVDIIPDHEDARRGRVCSEDWYDRFPEDTQENFQRFAECSTIMLLAGYAAAVHGGDDAESARIGAFSDFAEAYEFRHMTKDTEREWIERAEDFVRTNWHAIEAVARVLMQHRRIAAIDVAVLVADADSGYVDDAYVASFMPAAV